MLLTGIAVTVVMTGQAEGNDATAVINATLGNILGVIVSPSLLLAYLGQSSLDLPYTEILLKLGYSVVAPLVVGQFLQYMFPEYCKKARAKAAPPHTQQYGPGRHYLDSLLSHVLSGSEPDGC